MSELLEKRLRFTRYLCQLIDWANKWPGVQVAFGTDFDEADPNERRRHRKGSLHYLGLANDPALYINGIYQKDTEAYRFMGDWWKALDPDNRWGGDFKTPDGNHFSLTYQGKS